MSVSKLRIAIETLREPQPQAVEGRVVEMGRCGSYRVSIGDGIYTVPALNGQGALPGQRVFVLVTGRAKTPLAMLGAVIA